VGLKKPSKIKAQENERIRVDLSIKSARKRAL
jgi:hypothetical protein